MQAKLYHCPTGCTQRRTDSYWLAEKRTFTGLKCENCGFTVKHDTRPTYSVYSYSGESGLKDNLRKSR